MNRSLTRFGIACSLVLLVAWPSWGQKTGGSAPPAQPSAPTAGTNAPNIGSQPSIREAPQPLYVNGRVLMESGQPVPEPVSVGLNCGMRTVQVVHTDSKGYFQFVLGDGPQSNVDLSASDDTFGGGLGFPGTGGSFGGGGGEMLGCEISVSVSGYMPLTKTISSPPDIQGVDAGTLLLRRREGVTGSSISVTSLQIPDSARKEFDKGQKDERSKHLDTAQQHMQKAVTIYAKYAAAWNELGKIYATNHDLDKAHQSFATAITADPQYIPPYVSLAALELQTEQYDSAADTAGKLLALDPTIGLASFIQAAADFKLNKLDEAEKNAKDAENEPHQGIPQVHVLLAQIYVEKQDLPNAAMELRTYLKEAPKGPFADQAKLNLDGIAKQTGAGGGDKSGAPPEPLKTAP